MKQTLRHWPLVVIVVLTILLRLPLLNGSFWMDEAAQALQSARVWSEQLQIRDDFQPPLLHLIVAVAIRVDDSEWWLRTWGALIPGILTIVGTYFLAIEVGRWVFKPRLVMLNRRPHQGGGGVLNSFHDLGLFQHLKTYVCTVEKSIVLASLSALLLATSSFHVFYSQELRPYSLPAVWGIWSWWVLIKMLTIKIGTRDWWYWSMGWVVLSTLGLYSSYLYPFLLLSQIIWVVIFQSSRVALISLISRYAGHQPHHAEPKSEAMSSELVSGSGFVSVSSKSNKCSSNISYSSAKQSFANRPTASNQILVTICPWLYWLTLGLLILLAFLPWLPSFIDQLNAGQMLRLTLPGWETVVSTPQLKALALVGGKFLFGVSNISPNPYFAIYSLIFLGLVVICIYWIYKAVVCRSGIDPESSKLITDKSYRILKPVQDDAILVDTSSSNGMLKPFQHNEALVSRHGLLKALFLIATAFFVPLFTAWLVSFIVPVLQPKRVLYLLPFWYLGLSLLITIVITNYQSWRVRFWTIALLSLLLVFNLGSTIAYWLDPTLQRENWRQAWQEIDQIYGDQTPKLFLFDGPFASWQWYDQQLTNYASINDFSFTGLRTADSMQARSIVQKATNHYTQPTILYFDYLTDLTDPDRLVLTELAKRGYQPAEVLDYPNIGFVRVFRK